MDILKPTKPYTNGTNAQNSEAFVHLIPLELWKRKERETLWRIESFSHRMIK